MQLFQGDYNYIWKIWLFMNRKRSVSIHNVNSELFDIIIISGIKQTVIVHTSILNFIRYLQTYCNLNYS